MSCSAMAKFVWRRYDCAKNVFSGLMLRNALLVFVLVSETSSGLYLTLSWNVDAFSSAPMSSL